MSLELTDDAELVQSQNTGRFYATVRRCFISSTFDEETAKALIDTENHSADLYAHLGGYNEITLSAPFTPEKHVEANTVCENAGMEVIIIDSISHERGIKALQIGLKTFSNSNLLD
jgi:hypothetical protein